MTSKFQARFESEGEEENCDPFHAWSASDAAQEFTEWRYKRDGGTDLGDSVEVIVTDADGVEQRFEVSIEMSPAFSALEIS